ncbi:hypothetical protein TIFTF001_003139 [Ficus carica]|uniref:Uncharacterized protein n=1 Tax=Ficus carica TaxID=3494 RepID=A0AA87ZG64_FICCA|nr:hypothetical protein TIFTF001_003139 [Ficus carica]
MFKIPKLPSTILLPLRSQSRRRRFTNSSIVLGENAVTRSFAILAGSFAISTGSFLISVGSAAKIDLLRILISFLFSVFFVVFSDDETRFARKLRRASLRRLISPRGFSSRRRPCDFA